MIPVKWLSGWGCLPSSLMTWVVFLLGPTWWTKRNDSCWLFFDLHTCAMAWMPTHIIKYLKKNFYKNLNQIRILKAILYCGHTETSIKAPHFILYFFWQTVLLCSTGWLKLTTILMPQSPKCCDYSYKPTCLRKRCNRKILRFQNLYILWSDKSR